MTNRTIEGADAFRRLGDASLLVHAHLHPSDLASLAASCRRLRDDVRSNLFAICGLQLPTTLGVGSNYLVEFVRGHSFRTKDDLVDHVVRLTRDVGLLHMGATSFDRTKSRGATTPDESEAMARATFAEVTSAVFCSPRSERRRDRVSCTAECHYTPQLSDRESILSWVKYAIDRDACKGTGEDRETNARIAAWARWLTRPGRRGDGDDEGEAADAGLWRWTCKHRDLYGKGIAGAGVTFSRRDRAGGRIEDRLEVRLTRMY